MSPAVAVLTTNPSNPLDTAIHAAGRKLCALQMTRLSTSCPPCKGDAQDLTRDLLDIAKIVDDALLKIGLEARSHFGSDVDVNLFADQLRGALEGNATHTICAAMEADDDYEDGDTFYKLTRDAA